MSSDFSQGNYVVHGKWLKCMLSVVEVLITDEIEAMDRKSKCYVLGLRLREPKYLNDNILCLSTEG